MRAGAVAAAIERIDIDVAVAGGGGPTRTIAVVRKWTWPHEILGLAAAQAVRDRATPIPRLLAAGTDGRGRWLIVPFSPGRHVDRAELPTEVFEALALLHTAYASSWRELDGIPVVDARWWRDLCLSFALQAVVRQAARVPGPSPALDRARRVLDQMADDPGVAAVLESLPRSAPARGRPSGQRPRRRRQRGVGGLGQRSYRLPDGRPRERRGRRRTGLRRVLRHVATMHRPAT